MDSPDTVIFQFEGLLAECASDEERDVVFHEAEPDIDVLELWDSFSCEGVKRVCVSKTLTFEEVNHWLETRNAPAADSVSSAVDGGESGSIHIYGDAGFIHEADCLMDAVCWLASIEEDSTTFMRLEV